MDNNLENIDFDIVYNDLKQRLDKHLGDRLDNLYKTNTEIESYDMCLHLVLNVSHEDVFNTFLVAMDYIVDIEYEYNLSITVWPFFICRIL